MKCWQCGAVCELVEVTTCLDAQPRYMPGRWPAGDHVHSEHPPTPLELEQTGHAALMRLRNAE